jgi:hypothetical protein
MGPQSCQAPGISLLSGQQSAAGPPSRPQRVSSLTSAYDSETLDATPEEPNGE